MNEGLRTGDHSAADIQDAELRLECLARYMVDRPRELAVAWLNKQKPGFREQMRERMNQERERRRMAPPPPLAAGRPMPPAWTQTRRTDATATHTATQPATRPGLRDLPPSPIEELFEVVGL